MPADAYVMDADMKKVADAIRAKGKTTEPLTFPDGMVQAVSDIQTGGGHEVEDALITGNISGAYKNDRITDVKAGAFLGNSYMTAIDLPLATHIGLKAFQSCMKLSTVNLPLATSIDNEAFWSCRKLITIDLPSATSIGDRAFSDSDFLHTVNLPSATHIGPEAFKYCYGLNVVKLGANQVAEGGYNMFDGAGSAKIYVPDNLVEQYKTATNWSQYASMIFPMSQAPQ